MAIFKRAHLDAEKQELAEFYQRLTDALEGEAGHDNLAHQYGCESDQFAREYVNVDLSKVNYAFAHLKTMATEMNKSLKGKSLKPNRPR